ncbi:MAG: response regulator [Bdellovibrionales bacterium]|nr:response regulator [Bdellovibrionales bacterium]
MSRKKVLSVGQCGFDNSNISRMLQPFRVDIVTASSLDEAKEFVLNNHFELVLVNRVFDATGESGLTLIQELMDKKCSVPLMLVSNYEDAQAAALKLGAVPGFGKNTLNAPATKALLAEHLQSNEELES